MWARQLSRQMRPEHLVPASSAQCVDTYRSYDLIKLCFEKSTNQILCIFLVRFNYARPARKLRLLDLAVPSGFRTTVEWLLQEVGSSISAAQRTGDEKPPMGPGIPRRKSKQPDRVPCAAVTP